MASNTPIEPINKEIQSKRKNPLFFGFSLAYFFCMMVAATGLYSISGEFLFKMAVWTASYDILVPLVDNFGIAPFFLIYALIPFLFLYVRLSSKIIVEITDEHIIFKNIYVFPVHTYKINVSEIESASLMRIKPGEHKVEFFTKRAFTYKKILYISGNYSVRLASNLIKKDTIIMGTQKPKHWLLTLKERGINVQEDAIGEIVPTPKFEKGRVQSTQLKSSTS